MTLRGISLIAITALVVTGGMHAARWARHAKTVSPTAEQPVFVDSNPPYDFTFPSPGDLAVVSPDAPILPALTPEPELTMPPPPGLNEFVDQPRDVVESDLHPPVLAIYREFTSVPKASRPSGSTVVTGSAVVVAEGPELPALPEGVAEKRTAEAEPPTEAQPAQPLQGLKKLLEKELPEATAEERHLWESELKGLPPAAIRDLMQMRRRFQGMPEPMHPPADLGMPPRFASRPERLPMPEWPRPLPPRDIDAEANEPGTGSSDLVASETLMFEATQAAIRQARGIHLNNIANARTPGYRRVVVSFTELAAGDAEPNGDEPRDHAAALPGLGIQVASLRLDTTTQGSITETGEPLDVAIDGVGFLEVSHHGLPRFTRHGRLTLDAHRRLGIRCGSTIAILQPEVSLPEDAGAVRITDAGVVEVQSGSSEEWESAGTLSLVRFLNPSELQSRGQSLLAATPSSGAAQRGEAGKPGYGSFQPGCLEGSNVDVKAEQRAMLSLDKLWGSLTRETVDQNEESSVSTKSDQNGMKPWFQATQAQALPLTLIEALTREELANLPGREGQERDGAVVFDMTPPPCGPLKAQADALLTGSNIDMGKIREYQQALKRWRSRASTGGIECPCDE